MRLSARPLRRPTSKNRLFAHGRRRRPRLSHSLCAHLTRSARRPIPYSPFPSITVRWDSDKTRAHVQRQRRPLKTRGKSGIINDPPPAPPLSRRCLPASASRSTHFHFPSVSNVSPSSSSYRTWIHSLPIRRVQELLSQLSPRARSVVSFSPPLTAGLGGFRLLEKLCVGCQVKCERNNER